MAQQSNPSAPAQRPVLGMLQRADDAQAPAAPMTRLGDMMATPQASAMLGQTETGIATPQQPQVGATAQQSRTLNLPPWLSRMFSG